MPPFLLKLIPVVMDRLIPTKRPSQSSRDDFPAVIRKASARLGLNPLEKSPSGIRTDRSAPAQGKEKVEKRKNPDGTAVAIRDFEPLMVLLQESGIPSERTTAFLNSLTADHRDGKVPMGELLGRVRALLTTETGGDGQVHLEAKSRLRVESALTQWGLSPKEADRVLSLSSTGDGKLDVERFLKTTALRGRPEVENPKVRPKTESERAGAGSAGEPSPRADLTESPAPADSPKTRSTTTEAARGPATKASLASAAGAPSSDLPPGPEGTTRQGTILSFRAEDRKVAPAAGATGRSDERRGVTGQISSSLAGETPAAKQASEGMTVQVEKPQKSTPLSVHRGSEPEEQGAGRSDRSKGANEGNGPRRAAKDLAAEDGRQPPETRTYTTAGPGPQQHPAKPVGVPAQPSPSSENPVPVHVAAQVSKQISRAVQSGDQTIRLQLNPPELGMLKVQLEWSQDALKIEMVTDRFPVKDLLLASVPELKEALGEQGFRVQKMEVVVNDPSGQTLSYSGSEHRNPSGPGIRPGDETGAFLGEQNEKGRPGPPFNPLEGHLLDVVA